MYHYYFHLKYQKIMKYNEEDQKIFVGNQWMREILDAIDLNRLIGAKPLKFNFLQTKQSTKLKITENLIQVDNGLLNRYKL